MDFFFFLKTETNLREAESLKNTPNALTKETKQIKKLSSISELNLFSARVAYESLKFRPRWIIRVIKSDTWKRIHF